MTPVLRLVSSRFASRSASRTRCGAGEGIRDAQHARPQHALWDMRDSSSGHPPAEWPGLQICCCPEAPNWPPCEKVKAGRLSKAANMATSASRVRSRCMLRTDGKCSSCLSMLGNELHGGRVPKAICQPAAWVATRSDDYTSARRRVKIVTLEFTDKSTFSRESHMHSVQSERIANNADGRERHGCRRDDGRQQDPERRVEHASSDQHPCGIVDVHEKEVLSDVGVPFSPQPGGSIAESSPEARLRLGR
jgi:hypothetical protein